MVTAVVPSNPDPVTVTVCPPAVLPARKNVFKVYNNPIFRSRYSPKCPLFFIKYPNYFVYYLVIWG
jgi:hypothetical protein